MFLQKLFEVYNPERKINNNMQKLYKHLIIFTRSGYLLLVKLNCRLQLKRACSIFAIVR
jgi:hypothetical protein